MEEWKTLPGYPECEVSNMGNIRVKGKLKSQDIEKRVGYKRVSIHYDIKKRCYSDKANHLRVHQLVALVWCDNPQNKTYVNHINGKKGDNRSKNLEYCTPRENSMLAGKNGQLKGGKGRTSIIAICIEDGTRAIFESQKEAAERMGISDSEINKAIRGERLTSHGHKWYYSENFYENEYIEMEVADYERWLHEQENGQLTFL